MKIETPMTERVVAELKALGQRFNALDHAPARRDANAYVIENCDSIHISWSGVSFHYLDSRGEAHSVKISDDLLEGKRSFEDYWKTIKSIEEYDHEYDQYLDAKETYERLKEKYE